MYYKDIEESLFNALADVGDDFADRVLHGDDFFNLNEVLVQIAKIMNDRNDSFYVGTHPHQFIMTENSVCGLEDKLEIKKAIDYQVKEVKFEDKQTIRVDLLFPTKSVDVFFKCLLTYAKSEFIELKTQFHRIENLFYECSFEPDLKNNTLIQKNEKRLLGFNFWNPFLIERPKIDPRIAYMFEEKGKNMSGPDAGHMWSKTTYYTFGGERLYESGQFLSEKPSTGVAEGAKWFKIIEHTPDGKKYFIVYACDGGQEPHIQYSEKKGVLSHMPEQLQNVFDIEIEDHLLDKLKIAE